MVLDMVFFICECEKSFQGRSRIGKFVTMVFDKTERVSVNTGGWIASL